MDIPRSTGILCWLKELGTPLIFYCCLMAQLSLKAWKKVMWWKAAKADCREMADLEGFFPFEPCLKFLFESRLAYKTTLRNSCFPSTIELCLETQGSKNFNPLDWNGAKIFPLSSSVGTEGRAGCPLGESCAATSRAVTFLLKSPALLPAKPSLCYLKSKITCFHDWNRATLPGK